MANSLRVQPDGALHVFAGTKSVMHTDVTGLHANEVLAKHYGFENSPTIGFSAEAGNININSGTGAIRLRSKVELEQPLFPSHDTGRRLLKLIRLCITEIIYQINK